MVIVLTMIILTRITLTILNMIVTINFRRLTMTIAASIALMMILYG